MTSNIGLKPQKVNKEGLCSVMYGHSTDSKTDTQIQKSCM